MFATKMMTRALAATVVAGIALLGPAVTAVAATPGEAAPAAPLVSIGLDVGIGATVQVGSGPAVAPQPGPAVPAGAPIPSGVTPSVPVATPPSGAVPAQAGRLLSADVSVDACIAAALLGGRSVDGCGQPAGTMTPTLAQALARVGVCARLAILSDAPVDRCGTPTTARRALLGLETDDDVCLAASVLDLAGRPRCRAGSDSAETGETAFPPALAALDTEDRICLAASVLGRNDPAACGLEANEPGDGDDVAFPPALASLETDDQVCLAAVVLGGTDLQDCSIDDADPAGTEPTGPGVAGVDVGADVCLGLAVLTGADLSACPAEVAGEQVDGSDPDTDDTVGTSSVVAEKASFGSGSATAAHRGVSGSLPLTGSGSADVVMIGLALAAVGLAMRRIGRARSRITARD